MSKLINQANALAADKPDHYRFYFQRTKTLAATFIAHDGRAVLLNNKYSLASAERWANGPEPNPVPYLPIECCSTCQENWERAKAGSRQIARFCLWIKSAK